MALFRPVLEDSQQLGAALRAACAWADARPQGRICGHTGRQHPGRQGATAVAAGRQSRCCLLRAPLAHRRCQRTGHGGPTVLDGHGSSGFYPAQYALAPWSQPELRDLRPRGQFAGGIEVFGLALGQRLQPCDDELGKSAV